MTVTLEIPDDLLARFRKEAEARGLTVDQWLLELAEEHARESSAESRETRPLAQVFSEIRGLADDLDLSRDRSPGRDIEL